MEPDIDIKAGDTVRTDILGDRVTVYVNKVKVWEGRVEDVPENIRQGHRLACHLTSRVESRL